MSINKLHLTIPS